MWVAVGILVFLKVKGNSQGSRSGVRINTFGPGISSSNTAMQQRRLVSDSLKKEAEARRMRYLHIRQYEMQTNWLKLFDKVIAEDLTWQKILHGYSSRLLKFVMNLRANTLPSPDNLRRWNIKGKHVCGLCAKENVTINHILAGCPWVFQQNNLGLIDR